MIVRSAHPSNYRWLSERIDLCIGPQFRALEAVDATGRIHGMVGYDGFTRSAVSMHFAIEHPGALRSLLGPAFRVPFRDFGFKIAVATVLSTNERSMRLVPKIGFVETHRIVDGWDVGVDLVLFEMRASACRWLDQRTRRAA